MAGLGLEAFLELNEDSAWQQQCAALPTVETDPEMLAAELRAATTCGKAHALVVVAEGACNNAAALARHFVAHHITRGSKPRVITLGHVQLSILSNHSGHPQLRISTSSYP